MEWAEEYGVGEIGLAPEAFWDLTLREFWIKYRAFTRAESRARALLFEIALMVAPANKKAQRARADAVNALRQYPLKQWLFQDK